MEQIKQLLERLEDDTEYLVSFRSGKILGLKGFEKVDESIYSKGDVLIAWVVSQVKGDKRFFKPGTGIEFTLDDILEIAPKTGGEPLFQTR